MSEISWGKGRGSSGLFKPGFWQLRQHFSSDLRMSKTTMRLSTSDRTALRAYLATEFNRWVEDLLSRDELPLVGSAVPAMKQPQPRRGTKTKSKAKAKAKAQMKTSREEDQLSAPAAPAPEDQRPAPSASTPEEDPLKTTERRQRQGGTSGVGGHRTLARLSPSLASAPGPPPRRRRHRPRPRQSLVPGSATTVRAMATRPAAVPTRQSAHSAVARTLASTAFPNVRTAPRHDTTATSARKKVKDADPGSVRIAHDLHRRPSPPHPARTLKTPWTSLPPPATPPPKQTSISSLTSRHSSRTSETTTKSGNGNGSRTQTPWPSTYSPTMPSVKSRSPDSSSTQRTSSTSTWHPRTPSTAALPTAVEAANTSTRSPPIVSMPSTPASWEPTTSAVPPGRSTPSPSLCTSRPSWRRGRATRSTSSVAPATR